MSVILFHRVALVSQIGLHCAEQSLDVTDEGNRHLGPSSPETIVHMIQQARRRADLLDIAIQRSKATRKALKCAAPSAPPRTGTTSS